MSNVISIFDHKKKKESKEKEIDRTDYFANVAKKNEETAERLKRERSQYNKNLVKSQKLGR